MSKSIVYDRSKAWLRRYAFWIFTILCLVAALYFAPFSLIPNGVTNNANLGNFVTHASFNLPDNLINYTFHNTTDAIAPHDARFTIVLSGVSSTDIVAGNELLIEITMTANPALRKHVSFIYVDPNNSLIWPLQTDPSTGGPFFAYVNLYQTSNSFIWKGTQEIYYPESGNFGATVYFIRNDSYTTYQSFATFTLNMGPIMEIQSPDTILTRRVETYAPSLTFLGLFLAAIGVQLNSKHEEHKRKKMVQAVAS